MLRIFMFLFSATLFGCATSPAWVESGETTTIVWHKNQSSQPYVAGGVCHLFAPDKREMLSIFGEQIKVCFDRALTVKSDAGMDDPSAKMVTVVWHKVAIDRVANRKVELYGMPRPGSPEKALLGNIGGFFFNRNNRCNIVVPDAAPSIQDVGHETKHCFDGLFHDARGNWR